MDDDDLVTRVTDELFWDPKVDNVEIAVSADDGAITLRGTVGSLRQKRAAKKATERVYGVLSVNDELSVRVLNGAKRDDAELRGRVLQALVLNSMVPSTVDAAVKDGVVTLTGTASWQYQRESADETVANILGVVDVVNDVRLDATAKADDVRGSITKALERDARLQSYELSVDTSDGLVTISGTVGSWAEHDAVMAAAWSTPGVTAIDDLVLVAY